MRRSGESATRRRTRSAATLGRWTGRSRTRCAGSSVPSRAGSRQRETVVANDHIDLDIAAGDGVRPARAQRRRQDDAGTPARRACCARTRAASACSAARSDSPGRQLRRLPAAARGGARRPHRSAWRSRRPAGCAASAPSSARSTRDALVDELGLGAAGRPGDRPAVRRGAPAGRRSATALAGPTARSWCSTSRRPAWIRRPGGRSGPRSSGAAASHGATVVLVTHNVLEAESVLDRVAVLDAGRVIACDTPGRLKAQVSDEVRLELVWRGEPPSTTDPVVASLAARATVTGPALERAPAGRRGAGGAGLPDRRGRRSPPSTTSRSPPPRSRTSTWRSAGAPATWSARDAAAAGCRVPGRRRGDRRRRRASASGPATATVFRQQLARVRVARVPLLFVAGFQSIGLLLLLRGVVDRGSETTGAAGRRRLAPCWWSRSSR